MVIITSVTISLIVIASSYSYQILRQQRGASEFDIAKKSILAFNDALESAAFKPHASRSARFTVEYGRLELVEDAATLTVSVDIGGNQYTNSVSTDFVRYCTKTSYVSFGDGYKSYIFGDEELIGDVNAQSLGRAYIEEQSGWVNITLSYKVQVVSFIDQVVEEGTPSNVTYIDIYITRVDVKPPFVLVGDFDLVARCTGIDVESYESSVTEGQVCVITVQMGSDVDSTNLTISRKGKVVVNFVVANIEVGP